VSRIGQIGGAVARYRRRRRLQAFEREAHQVHELLKLMHADPSRDFAGHRQRKLRAILKYAAAHCPYYRRLFPAHGVAPSDLDTFTRIPLTDKAAIRDHLAEMVSDELDGLDKYRMNTGGSTGEPLEFPVHALAGKIDWVHQEFRHTVFYGWQPGERIAAFCGVTVPDERRRAGVYWVERSPAYEPYGRLAYSSLYLNEQTMPRYLEHLLEYRPVILRGYPSFFNDIADYLQRHRIRITFPIKAVELTSENAFDWQMTNIRAAFDAPVRLQYGHSEVCAYGYTQDDSMAYVFSPFYGYVEVLDEHGRQVPPGQRGEIVATGFYNCALPFIRYRTGDMAVLLGDARGVVRVGGIVGRTQDYVLTSDGGHVALTALVFGQHFHAFAHIRRWQIVQDVPGEVTISIVKTDQFAAADAEEIRQAFIAASGIDPAIKFVDAIPLTGRGKFRFLVQNIAGTASAKDHA